MRAKRALNFLSQISEFWKKSSNWRDICIVLLECKQTFTIFSSLLKLVGTPGCLDYRAKNQLASLVIFTKCAMREISLHSNGFPSFFTQKIPAVPPLVINAIHHIFTSAWDHMEKKKSSIVVRGKSEKRKELLETAKSRKRDSDKNPDIHQKLSMNIWYASLHFIHRP